MQPDSLDYLTSNNQNRQTDSYHTIAQGGDKTIESLTPIKHISNDNQKAEFGEGDKSLPRISEPTKLQFYDGEGKTFNDDLDDLKDDQ